MGNTGRCTDVGALSDLQWGYQGRVTAYKDAVFDHGLVLVDPVVVARDGASADIYAGSNLHVSKISQMVRLRAAAEMSFLRLYKVANVGAFADFAAGANVRVRADNCPGGDRTCIDD